MLYVGQTRSRRLIAHLDEVVHGEMTNRGELPPRRLPFAFDNGAFTDWRAGRDFQEEPYLADLDRLVAHALRPDFLVVPDIVGGGLDSLRFSHGWLPRLQGLGPLYLAVQDGMTPDDVLSSAHQFDGLFVGGTLKWKIRTGERWVATAHSLGLPCHIGRVGTGKRVRWAKAIGADSIDSCLPLFSADNLRVFLDAAKPTDQLTLFEECNGLHNCALHRTHSRPGHVYEAL